MDDEDVDPALVTRLLAKGVVLVPYDPAWPARFEVAAAAIREACAGEVTVVEHIGSTAIPGLLAKPVLDIMPGLGSYEDGFAIVAPMESLGYEYRGEFGIPRRHYFTKPVADDRHAWKHNVHCYVVGDPEWLRHLAFRDALRRDGAVRAAYQSLKLELAARFPDDVEAYAEAKGEFVDGVVRAYGGPPRTNG
ncbi:MAG: GrpB family protein [Dehalococcoidia bacterium]